MKIIIVIGMEMVKIKVKFKKKKKKMLVLVFIVGYDRNLWNRDFSCYIFIGFIRIFYWFCVVF